MRSKLIDKKKIPELKIIGVKYFMASSINLEKKTKTA